MPDQPPHNYIPSGPLEDPPFMGHCPDEIRREAFTAVLAGVDLGAWDLAMISHRVGADDDNELRWMTSLLWRARLAGRAEALEGAVTQWAIWVADDNGAGESIAVSSEEVARAAVPAWRQGGWAEVAVVSRQVTPWTEVPAPETAKEGGDD